MADVSKSGKYAAQHKNAFQQMSLPLPLAFNFEQLMELNRPALNAMAEMNGKAYENISTLNKTWVAFLNRRLKEDFAVPQQLASCKTVQDLFGVYRGFIENAVADYQAEFEELSKLGKSMTEETVAAVQGRIQEARREAQR